MKNTPLWIVVILGLVGAAAIFYYRWQATQPAPAVKPTAQT